MLSLDGKKNTENIKQKSNNQENTWKTHGFLSLLDISVEALVRRIQEIAEQAALEQVGLAGADSAVICCSGFF